MAINVFNKVPIDVITSRVNIIRTFGGRALLFFGCLMGERERGKGAYFPNELVWFVDNAMFAL